MHKKKKKKKNERACIREGYIYVFDISNYNENSDAIPHNSVSIC